MKKTDIYIKQGVQPEVRLHGSIRAMKWAHKNGYTNKLISEGNTFHGRPVWYAGMVDTLSVYSFNIDEKDIYNFIKQATKEHFTIQSDY